MTQATALDWGHPLVTPEGRTIRIPKFAFAKLRQLGLLRNNKNKLSPMIYEFMQPQYDCICLGLRQLLGLDLIGPKWLVCNCEECKAVRGDRDPDAGAKAAIDVMSQRGEYVQKEMW